MSREVCELGSAELRRRGIEIYNKASKVPRAGWLSGEIELLQPPSLGALDETIMVYRQTQSVSYYLLPLHSVRQRSQLMTQRRSGTLRMCSKDERTT